MQGLWGALNYCLGFKRCLWRHTSFSPQGYFTLMYGFPLQIGLIHLSGGFFFSSPFSPFRGMEMESMALCMLSKRSNTELPQPFPSLCILRKDLVKLPKLASGSLQHRQALNMRSPASATQVDGITGLHHSYLIKGGGNRSRKHLPNILSIPS